MQCKAVHGTAKHGIAEQGSALHCKANHLIPISRSGYCGVILERNAVQCRAGQCIALHGIAQ